MAMKLCTVMNTYAQIPVRVKPSIYEAFERVHTLHTNFTKKYKNSFWSMKPLKAGAWGGFVFFAAHCVHIAKFSAPIGLQTHSYMCALPCNPCTFRD